MRKMQAELSGANLPPKEKAKLESLMITLQTEINELDANIVNYNYGNSILPTFISPMLLYHLQAYHPVINVVLYEKDDTDKFCLIFLQFSLQKYMQHTCKSKSLDLKN